MQIYHFEFVFEENSDRKSHDYFDVIDVHFHDRLVLMIGLRVEIKFCNVDGLKHQPKDFSLLFKPLSAFLLQMNTCKIIYLN